MLGSQRKTLSKLQGNNGAAQIQNSNEGSNQEEKVKSTGGLKDKAMQDDRFKHLFYDPQFEKIKNSSIKTKVDDRFKHMFTDKQFQVNTQMDKYGIKRNDQKKNKELEEFYLQEGDDNSIEEEDLKIIDAEDDPVIGKYKKAGQDIKLTKKELKQQKGQQQEIVSDSENEGDQQDESQEEIRDPYENGFQWNEVSSSEQEQMDIDMMKYGEEGEEQDENSGDDEKKAPLSIQTSRRLALQNFDWQNMHASDLMVLFNSFKPATGVIISVNIYISDFGKKMLQEEEEHGPSKIFKDTSQTPIYQDDEHLNKKEKREKVVRRAIENKQQIIVQEGDETLDIDAGKLRKYEQERLMYYYAVIQCDSQKTAVAVYDQCDEQEFQKSNLPIDLRFVPDHIKFSKENLKQSCSDLKQGNSLANLSNRAVGHTHVKLTWEEPNFNRTSAFEKQKGKLKVEDYDQIDVADLVGSGSASENNQSGEEEGDKNLVDESSQEFVIDDDEIEEARVNAKNSRLNDYQEGYSEDGGDDEDNEDQQIGSKQNSKKKHSNSDWRSNFDKQSKKKGDYEMQITFNQGFADLGEQIKENKENKAESVWEKYLNKKKEKQQLLRIQKMNSKNITSDKDDFFLNPEEQKEEQNRQKQYLDELSLLVDDQQKDGEFQINIQDPRWEAIYNQHDYAIDPTHKDFQQQSSGVILNEQIVRRKKLKQEQDHY